MKHKEMKNIILCFLLAFSMIVSLLPCAAFAEDYNAGNGEENSPYQLGDTVINDGSFEPIGYTVSNSFWKRTDIEAGREMYCGVDEHMHDTSCIAACVKDGHPADNFEAEFIHEDGSVCVYDFELSCWYNSDFSAAACGSAEHVHAEGLCYADKAACTLWTLTALEALTVMDDAKLPLENEIIKYSVNVIPRNSGKALRYVSVEVYDESCALITDCVTDRNARAVFELYPGFYTAKAFYKSGDREFVGEQSFVVDSGDAEIILDVSGSFMEEDAKRLYEGSEYFECFDFGFADAIAGNSPLLDEYNVVLNNVSVEIDNPEDRDDYKFCFENSDELCQWRSTDVKIYKNSQILFRCDIADCEDGEILKSGVSFTYRDGVYDNTDYGCDEYCQAIMRSDTHQGLGFIIDAEALLEPLLCTVSYKWELANAEGNIIGELPENIAPPLPETAKQLKGRTYIIDRSYCPGDSFQDEFNRKNYIFSGWKFMSGVSGTEMQAISSSETCMELAESIIFYGYWTVNELELAESYVTVKQSFVDNFGVGIEAPKSFSIKVADPVGGCSQIVLSEFTYDENSGVYSYKLPVRHEGAYTFDCTDYSVPGYSASVSNSVYESAQALNAWHDHVVAGEGPSYSDSCSVELALDYESASACAECAEISFMAVYEKQYGADVHNYPELAVHVQDADELENLQGANFGLYKSYSNASFEGDEEYLRSTSLADGYLHFDKLIPGTYYLSERVAPEGYISGGEVYRVIVELKEGYPREQLCEDKFCQYYDYDMDLEYSENGISWQRSPYFAYSTADRCYRLPVFNEAVNGQINISKSFIGIDDTAYPEGISLTLLCPDDSEINVVLCPENGWKTELTGMELGNYRIYEDTLQLPGYKFIETAYNESPALVFKLSEKNLTADYDRNEPVAVLEINSSSTYEKVSATKDIYPDLEIVLKRDSGGELLHGVKLALYDDYKDGVLSGKISETETNLQGRAFFTGLEQGDYYLKETLAPLGYAEKDIVYRLNVEFAREDEAVLDEENNVHVIARHYDIFADNLSHGDSFDEERNRLTIGCTKNKGSIIISKSFGVDNEYLPGSIAIELSGPDGYSELVTLAAANAWTATITGLELGEYKVNEMSRTLATDEGLMYSLDSVTSCYISLSSEVENGHDLSVGRAELKSTYTRMNIRPASFVINNIDSTSNELIAASAAFGLYSDPACNKLIQTQNTGDNGQAVFHGFATEGKYYVRQISAPANYEQCDDIWEVKVSLENGEPVIEAKKSAGVFERLYNKLRNIDEPEVWAAGQLNVHNQVKKGSITVNLFVNDICERNAGKSYSFCLQLSSSEKTEKFSMKAGESLSFDNIPYGTDYVLNGDRTNAAYVDSIESGEGKLESAAVNITVTNTYNYNILNKGLNITLRDAEDVSIPVADAGFALYADENCTVECSAASSNEDGVLHLSVAQPGSYYLKQTAAAEGYHIDESVYSVIAEEKYVVLDAGKESARTEKQLRISVDGLESTAKVSENAFAMYSAQYKKIEISVQKKWAAKDEAARPQQIEICLYRDGQLYDSYMLSAENNWSHIWSGEEFTDEYEWTVEEKVNAQP